MRKFWGEPSLDQRSGFNLDQAVQALAALLAIAVLQSPVDARTHSKKSAASAPAHHSVSASHSSASAHSARHSGVSSRHTVVVSTHHGSRSTHVVTTTVSGRHSHVTSASLGSRHHKEEPATHLVAHIKRGKHGRKIVVYEKVKDVEVTAHHGRHQQAQLVTHEAAPVVRAPAAPKTRYAYPLSFFMMHPPEFERGALPADVADKISRSFQNGYADSYAARSLVRAGLVSYHPLRGGIFWRREPVKYIIMHSTETGIPLSAERVIESWSSSGLRHAGAQYVVERDGTIFQAVDPDLGTVHINIFKTLPGINNDNSIGIEMCHTGRQDYPAAQLQSVIKLVAYLQERYKVSDENVITHRYAQQGDHTDPVNFDWDGFIANKNSFRNRAIAYKVRRIKDDVKDWSDTTSTTTTTVTTTTVTPATVVPSTVVPSTVVTTPIVPAPVAPAPVSPVTVNSTVVRPGSATTSQVKEYTYSKPSDVSVPEASTYLQPHRLMPALPVYKTTTTTTSVTTTPNTVQEPKMILFPPAAEAGKTPPVAPMVLPKNMPALRGPIEMPPQSAPGLNTVPVPGN